MNALGVEPTGPSHRVAREPSKSRRSHEKISMVARTLAVVAGRHVGLWEINSSKRQFLNLPLPPNA